MMLRLLVVILSKRMSVFPKCLKYILSVALLHYKLSILQDRVHVKINSI